MLRPHFDEHEEEEEEGPLPTPTPSLNQWALYACHTLALQPCGIPEFEARSTH